MKKLFVSLVSVCLLSNIYAQDKSIQFQSTIKVDANDLNERIIEKAAHIIPTANQLSALQNEFIAFIHFGPNTFTRMEWGSGMEDPKIFDLKELDTDQWCEAMKAAGMKMVILTAKHHDGFVLWQSRYTKHGIMSTHFREGKGDIMKDLSNSCRKYGLKLGVYLSPADLYQIENPTGLYGNLSEYTLRTIPREVLGRPFENKTRFEFVVDDYNEYFLNQLFELLTEYGTIHEVWFDGAHPKTKGGQKYNYLAWRKLIQTLAPQAVVFGKEDIRWCGNEGGYTRDTEWNVIPYNENPNSMNDFMDLYGDLGTRDILCSKQKPYYLHYQPAETNTSIREGWFYRDDTHQQTRSTDDVFDIYERAVGGNSIFLLNIPPNRDGKFSPTDVDVLKETGARIRETYDVDLLKNADVILDKQPQEIIVATTQPITINRIAIQEAVGTQGERVEKHAVDAFIDGSWKEIAQASNIGYRRILRFPEVTTAKIRIRILESRLTPAISSISAHYYRLRPPMLSAQRDLNGLVAIEHLQQNFNWNKRKKEDSQKSLNSDFKIYYTTDGKDPDAHSTEYKAPFAIENKELKAVSVLNGEKGPIYHERFGWIKKAWKILNVSSEKTEHPALAVFDENPDSYWTSNDEATHHSIGIDIGKAETLNGFAYTPQQQHYGKGMMEEGIFQISKDGKTWKDVEIFQFGNLINDPVKRRHYFKKAVKARYIRIVATKIAGNEKAVSMAELDLF
ncbi:hypothetical protein AGMMS4956_17480 [Bacteroidia bacterium]|nr:hypothetical protein AGMMS4956_17480 [Bacteroidia bacterium]